MRTMETPPPPHRQLVVSVETPRTSQRFRWTYYLMPHPQLKHKQIEATAEATGVEAGAHGGGPKEKEHQETTRAEVIENGGSGGDVSTGPHPR
jgi:hypothetical protein